MRWHSKQWGETDIAAGDVVEPPRATGQCMPTVSSTKSNERALARGVIALSLAILVDVARNLLGKKKIEIDSS